MTHLLSMSEVWIGATVVGGIILLIIFLFAFQYIGLWVQAWVSGASVRFIDLIMMRFRKVKPRLIVENRITAKKADIDITTEQLESHYLAGGHITAVTRAVIAAKKAC